MMVRYEIVDGVMVVTLTGALDSASADKAENDLMMAINASDGACVIDLSAVTFVSSAGLRVLLLVAKRMDKRSLLLCSLPAQVREVFDLAGFHLIFTVVAHQSAALEALSAEV